MEKESLHIGYVCVCNDGQAQRGYLIDLKKIKSMNITDYLNFSR